MEHAHEEIYHIKAQSVMSCDISLYELINLFSLLHHSYIIIWRKIKWICTNPAGTKLIFASPENEKMATRFRECQSKLARCLICCSTWNSERVDDLMSHRSWKQGTLWNSLTLHKCVQHNFSHGETVMWLIISCCESPELMSPRTISKEFALA